MLFLGVFPGGFGVGLELLVGPAGLLGLDGRELGVFPGVVLGLPGLEVAEGEVVLGVLVVLPVVLVALLRLLGPADLVGVLILDVLAVVLERALLLVAVAAHLQQLLRRLLDILSDELQLLDFLFIFVGVFVGAPAGLHDVDGDEEVAGVVLVVEGDRSPLFPGGDAAGALGRPSLAFYLLSALHRSIISIASPLTSVQPALARQSPTQMPS